MDTYTRLKSRGVMPARPIRHGLTLSLYYRDPDGNGLEFQIDLMEEKDASEFMSGPAFAANPIGEPFDPEALAERLAQGKPVNDLIFRSDQAESKATPGVATATELQGALSAGCPWVKAFPASALGPAWFREMRGPFPAVNFVATGGSLRTQPNTGDSCAVGASSSQALTGIPAAINASTMAAPDGEF